MAVCGCDGLVFPVAEFGGAVESREHDSTCNGRDPDRDLRQR